MTKYTIQDVYNAVHGLSVKLYGENGFEGDIQHIKNDAKEVCSKQNEQDIDLNKNIRSTVRLSTEMTIIKWATSVVIVSTITLALKVLLNG